MPGPATPRDPDGPSGSRGAAGAVGLAGHDAGTRNRPGARAGAGAGAGAGGGPDGAAVGREARRTSHGSRRVGDVVATVLLLVLLAVESVAAGGAIVFLSMAFHSCAAPGNSCDVGLGSTVVTVGPVLAGLVFVATLLGCTLRLVRRRLAWPIALVGIAAQIVVFSAALLLVDSAVQHGF